jgi:hypothetical protein
MSKLSFLIPLQSVAFKRLVLAFRIAYNVRVLVSGYQSIGMYCTVVSVKFEGGLTMPVLRNK